MTIRKFTMFLIVALAWTTAVALLGFANMPKTVLPYAQAHAPSFIYVLMDVWGLIPLAILLALLGRTSFGAALLRRLRRGRDVPPDREKWGIRVGSVAVIFMAVGQGLFTLALVLLWHKHQLPWVAQALRGPHWAGLPDPSHLLPRLWLAAGGALLAWVGNGLPKLLSPFRGAPEPYDWNKMMRTFGWVMTLCGLVGAACGLFVADLRAAVLAGAAFMMAPAVAVFPIRAIYRFSGGQSGAAPPKGL